MQKMQKFINANFFFLGERRYNCDNGKNTNVCGEEYGMRRTDHK